MTIVSIVPLRPVITDRHQEGDLRYHDGRFWRVGMVSEIRMRLDPATGELHSIKDRVITDYGKCINVSPRSWLEVYDSRIHGDLDPQVQARLDRLEKKELIERRTQQEIRMAKVTPQVVAPPGSTPLGIVPKGKPEAEKARLASIASRAASRTASVVPDGAVKTTPSPTSAPRATKSTAKRQCMCGCPEMVTGFFAQGHDARFKGWMTKVERGEMEINELPKYVQQKFKFVKKGDGFVTTHNYKGEPHTGYDKGSPTGKKAVTAAKSSPMAKLTKG